MTRNARAFLRGIEAALAKRTTLKDYLVKDVGRTPEQVANFLAAVRAELEAMESE